MRIDPSLQALLEYYGETHHADSYQQMINAGETTIEDIRAYYQAQDDYTATWGCECIKYGM